MTTLNVTPTLNVATSFNESIAARGLFLLYFSLDHRFSFHDNAFDLLVVSSRECLEKLEFWL